MSLLLSCHFLIEGYGYIPPTSAPPTAGQANRRTTVERTDVHQAPPPWQEFPPESIYKPKKKKTRYFLAILEFNYTTYRGIHHKRIYKKSLLRYFKGLYRYIECNVISQLATGWRRFTTECFVLLGWTCLFIYHRLWYLC